MAVKESCRRRYWPPAQTWIQKYIFPGGLLRHAGIDITRQHTGLRIVDASLHCITPNAAPGGNDLCSGEMDWRRFRRELFACEAVPGVLGGGLPVEVIYLTGR